MFFDIEINLSKTFPALTPIQIRRERASEVFKLIERLNDYNERQYINSGGRETDEIRNVNGKQVVFRKAGDSWF